MWETRLCVCVLTITQVPQFKSITGLEAVLHVMTFSILLIQMDNYLSQLHWNQFLSTFKSLGNITWPTISFFSLNNPVFVGEDIIWQK